MASTDPEFAEWWGRWERLSSSPGTVEKRMDLQAKMDVREILPQVQAPTLILDRPQARAMDSRHSRYFAEHIPGAKLVELPGRDAISFGEGFEEYMEAIEQFTRGSVAVRRDERALATVMFTDIVGSTEMTARLGDRRSVEIVRAHDALVRRALARHGGREVKHTGDGSMAWFDDAAASVACTRAIL